MRSSIPSKGRVSHSLPQFSWGKRIGPYKKRFAFILNESWPSILVLATLMSLWEYFSDVGILPAYVAPAPSVILIKVLSNTPTFLKHSLVTFQAVMFGYAFGLFIGIPLGILLTYSRFMNKALYPLVIISQTIPIVALAPILMTLFGFGIMPKLIIVALITFFPITVSTVDGLRSVEPEMLQFLRSLGASERQIFFKVKVPATLPRVFTGIKVSVTYAVSAAIIGEWIGAHYGLGALMIRAQNMYYMDLVFGAVLVTALLAFFVQRIAIIAEMICIPWHLAKRKRK